MSKLEIITVPDPMLKEVSAPVEHVDDELRKFLDDMLETMYDAPGVGLAAVQVAVLRRILVMDASPRDEDDADKHPICMINPEVLSSSETMRAHEEGCLSIPEIFAEIERPEKIRVRYLDRDGKQCEHELEGFAATIAQHEIDHLNGVLFIDHLSRLKRDRLLKKYIKNHKPDALV